jgi:hypothetical protein
LTSPLNPRYQANRYGNVEGFGLVLPNVRQLELRMNCVAEHGDLAARFYQEHMLAPSVNFIREAGGRTKLFEWKLHTTNTGFRADIKLNDEGPEFGTLGRALFSLFGAHIAI